MEEEDSIRAGRKFDLKSILNPERRKESNREGELPARQQANSRQCWTSGIDFHSTSMVPF